MLPALWIHFPQGDFYIFLFFFKTLEALLPLGKPFEKHFRI